MAVQFNPVAQLRVFDSAVYNQIKSDYGLVGEAVNPGVTYGLIEGVAPSVLQTQYGLHTATSFKDIPGMLYTDSSEVLNTQVPTDVSGPQVLSGQDYIDPNGQHFTEVTWQWRVSVQLFDGENGTFTQEIVTWTGDATSNRLIPTTADLTTGETAIWIFSNAGAPVLATSSMIAAGKFATYSIDPASTTTGVVALEAGGFRITGGANVVVNTNTTKFQAIVWHDTLGSTMKTGTYTGNYNGVPPFNSGQTVTTGLEVNTTMGLVTGGAQAGVPDGAFYETDHNVAYNLSTAEGFPLSGVLTNSGTDFVVGASITLNLKDHIYYYVAFAIPQGTSIRTNLFDTWTVTGSSGSDIVTGLGFTPLFALARTYEYPTFGAAWRGPTDTGTASHSTSIGGGLATGGIEAIGAGTLTLGSVVSPAGVTVYGFAIAGGTANIQTIPTPTFVASIPVPNPVDPTNPSVIQVPRTTVDPGPTEVLLGTSPTFQWWCNSTFGWSVYQIDSPGAGWVACSGPASLNGWYLNTAGFGGTSIIVSAGQPGDPRTWGQLSTWCTVGNMSVFGGAPGAGCVINNKLVYAARSISGTPYVVGTDYPPIRIFDGRSDRELCRLPPTTANVIPKAVMSMLAANGTVYLTTFDSGTSSADWNGRVYQLDPETGVLTVLGTKFADGEMPYALCWHMGRLWCGTNNSIGTIGKVYFFRPGIDTAWTQDYATASSSAGGVTSMVSYQGKLYVGTDNAAGSRGKVLVRDTAGAYTTSQTGSGGTARVNNGYLSMVVLGSNLYASYWNKDTTVISKIEKFTGSAWSTAYTGVTTTLCPYVVLALDNNEVYAVGGSLPYDAVLLVTADGTTWTDLTSELPNETATLLPMFGTVVV